MTTKEQWGEPDRLLALTETKQKLAAIEREWKHWRDQSRTLTLELITLHGYSVSLASQLSGHHRNTITVWLQVYNAEKKSARPPAAGAGPQGEK